MAYYVYMMASGRNGTIYIGVAGDLLRRAWQHREHVIDGFTKKYKVTRLVYFESFESIISAIKREKQLKRYKREWKIDLIENQNPDWVDLFPSLSP